MNPVVKIANSNLLIEKHLQRITRVEIPVAEIVAQGGAALAALLCAGCCVAQRGIVADGTTTEPFAETDGVGDNGLAGSDAALMTMQGHACDNGISFALSGLGIEDEQAKV